MSKTINTRIINRKDSSSAWTQSNPTLLDGEIAIVRTDAGETRLKIGNGESNYTSLPFIDEPLRNGLGEYTMSMTANTAETWVDGTWSLTQTVDSGHTTYGKYVTRVALAAASKTGKTPRAYLEDANGVVWNGDNLCDTTYIYLYSNVAMAGTLVINL